MREEISIAPALKIKWKGIFDFDELYKNMKYSLEYRGYGDHESNFQEKKYVERIKGDSKQVEIRWVAQKNYGPYFAHVFKITFLILGMKEIETEVNGRKMKSNHGEIEIKISSDLIKDRKNKWNIGFMQYFYEKFIVRDRFENLKMDFYSITYAFHDEIKNYLTM